MLEAAKCSSEGCNGPEAKRRHIEAADPAISPCSGKGGFSDEECHEFFKRFDTGEWKLDPKLKGQAEQTIAKISEGHCRPTQSQANFVLLYGHADIGYIDIHPQQRIGYF